MFFLGGMTMGYLDPPVKTDRQNRLRYLFLRKRTAG